MEAKDNNLYKAVDNISSMASLIKSAIDSFHNRGESYRENLYFVKMANEMMEQIAKISDDYTSRLKMSEIITGKKKK
jgi:hypothetical protein